MPVLTENFKMRPKHNWYSNFIRKCYTVNPTRPTTIMERAKNSMIVYWQADWQLAGIWVWMMLFYMLELRAKIKKVRALC